MSFYGKIGVRLLVLANFFLAFNFIYEGTMWSSDMERLAPYFKDFQHAIRTADVLYLGDCSDQFFRPTDATRKPLSRYLNEALPNANVQAVSRDGFHAQAYRKLLDRWRPRDSTTVRTLIVTLNMRSLAPQIRYHKNENTLQRNLKLVERHPPLFNRVEVGFKMYPYLEPHQMEAAKNAAWQQPYPATEFTNRELTSEHTPRTFLAERLAQVASAHDSTMAEAYIKNYGFPLNLSDDAMLLAFDEIATHGAELGVEVVFVLLPENLLEAQQFGGPTLVEYMEWKRETLVQRYRSQGVFVVDAFDLLQPSDFVEELPNSHYTANGRQRIASAIAVAIEALEAPQFPGLSQ